MIKKPKPKRTRYLWIHILCIIACIIFMYPLIIMMKKSVAVNGFDNYAIVFNSMTLYKNFFNSCLIVGSVLLVVFIILSLTAFAFSKLEFPGKHVLYYVLLMGMMMPTAALVFPVFVTVKQFGLLGSRFSVVLPYAALACCFNLMMLKNYFDTLPDALMEATYMDGGSNLKSFIYVMLPLAKPGIAFTLIQTFLLSWNELQLAMTFITDKAKLPLSVVPIYFSAKTGSAQFPVQVIFAALIICLAPIAIFYVFASRFMVEGMTSGAVKG